MKCDDCKRELCSENVTFEEKCDTCGHSAIWIETEDDESVEQMLQELKQRRESSLRPATKFVKSTLFQHNDKLIEEFDEVQAAFYDYTEDSLEKDKEHLIEEIIDLQFAAETWLAGLGLDEKQRMQARRKVIAKNQTRGYYCE